MAVKQHNRITGKALGLTVGGTDYWADIVSCAIEASKSDKDGLTFADYAGGGVFERTLKVKAIQSTDPTSFHQLIEKSIGQELKFIVSVHGNKTATENQPHYEVTCKIDLPPTISTEAGEEKGAVFELEWKCLTYAKKTTSSNMGAGNMTDALAG